MSLLPHRGVCMSCGHDHGNRFGLPSFAPTFYPAAPLPAAPAPTEQAAQELTATALYGHESANLAVKQEELPPLPELDSLADLAYAQITPDDWDEDYRATWQKLQVAARNNTQWRVYAIKLRAALAARQAPTGQPAMDARRFCNGDREWTDWAAIDPVEYERRKGDDSFEFRARQVGAPDAERDAGKMATIMDIPPNLRNAILEGAAHAVWARAKPSDEIFVATAVEAIRALKVAQEKAS